MKVLVITVVLALVAYSPSAGTKTRKTFLVCNRWTPFHDCDDPSRGGDYETLANYRKARPNDNVCARPATLEYETISNKACINTGEVITASPTYGFACVNSLQPDQYCNDYKVRFCCLDAQVTCPDGYEWTNFYDRDNPSGTGDWELLRNLRDENPNRICERPIAIDVRRRSNGRDFRTCGENVTVSPSYGFLCLNRDQDDYYCQDYKVRFCCPCDK
ncbi:hypothetical protein SNE40_008695 [Patella caerulea]|uniref:WxxW domain-containing protein n=1 Tax=Patella caerulea TaxID=87958 RepID=A0AAN8Q1Z5_PATCE